MQIDLTFGFRLLLHSEILSKQYKQCKLIILTNIIVMLWQELSNGQLTERDNKPDELYKPVQVNDILTIICKYFECMLTTIIIVIY